MHPDTCYPYDDAQVMAVPAMYGYAAVIFRDPLYATSMPTLSKLVCWSSAVHQVNKKRGNVTVFSATYLERGNELVRLEEKHTQ